MPTKLGPMLNLDLAYVICQVQILLYATERGKTILEKPKKEF